MAKREGGPLLDFVQLKVLYWNLYGLGMALIFRSYQSIIKQKTGFDWSKIESH